MFRDVRFIHLDLKKRKKKEKEESSFRFEVRIFLSRCDLMTRIMRGIGKRWGRGGGGKRGELLPWQVLVDSTQTLCQGKLQEVATVRQSLWTLRQLETLLLSRSLFACVRACVRVCVCVCVCVCV